ncbi:30S ribosomal protein S4e [Candidatus Micrarchaeota archaeon]|nr:30S ribosomal protein S4e [Candidatus Micrarchaeota archaeon]
MTQRKQMKRLAAPKGMKILRKAGIWTVRTHAGPHTAKNAVPLLVLVRDYLKLTDTARETRKIIKAEQVLVDGRPITDVQFSVGFMDIVTIPASKKSYRILFDEKGRIVANETSEKSNFKLCRIEKIMQTKHGVQLTMHDGRNIITKEKLGTGDVLKIEVPTQKILEHYPLKEGSVAYIIAGKHAGETVKISGIIPGTITRRKQIQFKIGERDVTTPHDYVFVVGKDKPAISLK